MAVDRACNQLFPTPGFPENQYGGICRSHGCNSIEGLDDRPAVSHNLFEVVFLGNLFLQVNVLSFELLLQSPNLLKSCMQVGFGVLADQLGSRAGCEDLDEIDGFLAQRHGLVMQYGDVTHHPSVDVHHGNAQIAVSIDLLQEFFMRKQLLKPMAVVTYLPSNHLHAGRSGDVELPRGAEFFAVPKSQPFCMDAILASGSIRIARAQSGCQAANQYRKEIGARGRCRAFNDRTESLFGKVPLCHVVDQANYAYNSS